MTIKKKSGKRDACYSKVKSRYKKWNEERCCLLINNPNNDLTASDGQYLVWKSRSKRYKKNALSITPSKKCTRVNENKWALTFSESLYKINRMGIT